MATEETTQEEQLTGDDRILARALRRFDNSADESRSIRSAFVEDVAFNAGKQWDAQVEQERQQDGRPCFTINRVRAFKNQVVNTWKQNRPSIKVRPKTEGTSLYTAEVIDGLIRHIMNNGDSKGAIDTAFDYAAMGGFGFVRVNVRYCADTGFEQEIYLERIENPASVYVPWHLCKKQDMSDLPYAFIRIKMSKDDFKRQYPKSKDKEGYDKSGVGDNSWVTEDSVYIAEYYEIEYEKTVLYEYLDPNTNALAYVKDLPDGVEPLRSRDVFTPTVNWYLLTQFEVLDREKWAGKTIPIVPFIADEIIVNNKKELVSITRNARHPQIMLNHWVTSFTEQVALQPKSPWLVAVGQITKKLLPRWKTANTKNHAFLEYDASKTAPNGNPLPAPQRIAPPQVGDALTMGVSIASDAMKQVTGMYDPSLGNESNETSGKAIIARQHQGDTANFHLYDNATRAIRRIGQIFLELIPKVYDSARSVIILGEDMAPKIAVVNQVHKSKDTGDMTVYDTTKGEYEVFIDVGPSYETKRIEAVESLNLILQNMPNIAVNFLDLLFQNMDVPNANRMAARARAMLPPQVLQADQQADQITMEAMLHGTTADLQKIMQELQMTQAQRDQLIQAVQQLQGALKDKQEGMHLKYTEILTKAQTELQKAQVGLQAEVVKQHGAANLATVDAAMQMHQMSASPNLPAGTPGQPSPSVGMPVQSNGPVPMRSPIG